ncbi:MAG: hypothetical protein CM15mP40_02960 [Alphaproteobacteria bacterium]|nr:MAG: hypothetical protein CM15mP40_02960 [Alphaproteobacteria bacterium]
MNLSYQRNLKGPIINKLHKICLRISRFYNLNGINNLDLILEFKTKKLFVIELNARPGLSTNMIYSKHKAIFKKSFEKEKLKNPSFFFWNSYNL